MIISLTKEELEQFAQDMEKWNSECLVWVITHYSPRDYPTAFRDRPTDHLLQLLHQYEKEHPKPNWRTLL